jgi:hypothetical protein
MTGFYDQRNDEVEQTDTSRPIFEVELSGRYGGAVHDLLTHHLRLALMGVADRKLTSFALKLQLRRLK